MRQLSILSVFLALIALAIALSKAELAALPWYSKTILGMALLWLIVFGALASRLGYNINWGLPVVGVIKVSFRLPLSKRLLRLWSPPQLGKVKAEVRYKYGDMTGWTFPITGDWEEENEVWILLDGPMEKRLEIWWVDSQGNCYTADINRNPLSDRFDTNIRLSTENGRYLATHTISYKKGD